jgi:hypothetical protein
MKKTLQLILGLLLTTTVLIACSDDAADESDQEEPTEEESTEESTGDESGTESEVDSEGQAGLDIDISDDEKTAADDVVLEINGEEVLGEDYNTAYVDTKRYLLQNNQDASDKDMLKQQTVQTLQSNTLVEQDAESLGIEITEVDIDEALEQTKSQFETDEEYQQALNQLAYTEESFKASLKTQLTQQAYLDEAVEVGEVTDEEVEEYYGMLGEQSDDLPPLEEVEEQIVMQLEQSKVQQAFQEKVNALTEEADIKQNI